MCLCGRFFKASPIGRGGTACRDGDGNIKFGQLTDACPCEISILPLPRVILSPCKNKKARMLSASVIFKKARRSVSRILSRAIICLGLSLPINSSDIEERADNSYALTSCAGRGLQCPPRCRGSGEPLPRRFTFSLSGSLLSVALSLKSPSPVVSRRPCPAAFGLSSCLSHVIA